MPPPNRLACHTPCHAAADVPNRHARPARHHRCHGAADSPPSHQTLLACCHVPPTTWSPSRLPRFIGISKPGRHPPPPEATRRPRACRFFFASRRDCQYFQQCPYHQGCGAGAGAAGAGTFLPGAGAGDGAAMTFHPQPEPEPEPIFFVFPKPEPEPKLSEISTAPLPCLPRTAISTQTSLNSWSMIH